MTSGDNHRVPANPTERRPGLFGGIEEIFRFGVSGGMGTAVFAAFVWFLYAIGFDDTRTDDAIRWALPYVLTGFLTHTLHRRITFRWPSPYWQSLRRTFVIYGTSLVLTTLIHDQLIWWLGLPRSAAFALSVALSGAWNYLLFRHWGFVEQRQS